MLMMSVMAGSLNIGEADEGFRMRVVEQLEHGLFLSAHLHDFCLGSLGHDPGEHRLNGGETFFDAIEGFERGGGFAVADQPVDGRGVGGNDGV